MSKALITLVLFLHFFGANSQKTPLATSENLPPSHKAWHLLLTSHVQADGMVDYNGFQNDRSKLEAYLLSLSEHIPGKNWGREELLAYYINLYNAATVLLIIDHLPVASIRDISKPWGKKFIRIGKDMISLSEVEHGILRKLEEPRIHFAINCASLSCPKLLPFAFEADSMESQLELATRDFINDPERNAISSEKALLSKIFKWYRKDFTKGGSSLIQFLNPYLHGPIPEDTPIEYLPYDWSLNTWVR